MSDTNIPDKDTLEESIDIVSTDVSEDSVNSESSSTSVEETVNTENTKDTEETSNSEKTKNTEETSNTENTNVKKKLPPREIVRYTIMGISLIVFIVSVSMLIYYISQYRKSNKIYEDLNEEVLETTENNTTEYVDEESSEHTFEILNTIDFEYLKSINPECVAWISFPVLGIEYPVVQGNDNSYYLTHSYNNVEAWAGSIFMDYRNLADCSSRHTLIYGHNMQDGSMFAKLLKYDNESFYKKNEGRNYFYIYLEEGVEIYEIYAVVDAAVSSNPIPFSLNPIATYTFETYEKEIDALQLYDTGVTIAEDSKLVTLLTCQYDSSSDVRHLMIGKYITTVK